MRHFNSWTPGDWLDVVFGVLEIVFELLSALL